MRRQSRRFLMFFGAIIAVLAAHATAQAADLFINTNTDRVNDCAQPVVNCAPKFQLGAPATIDTIQTYHRQGAAPAGKTLGLKDTTNGSIVVVPVPVTTQPASPGFEDWTASIGGQQLPAGTYQVIDSQADTWQQNARSCDGPGVVGAACDKGFAIVRGNAAPAVVEASESVTDCSATCTVTPGATNQPAFACSAHGPHSTCVREPASAENPGGGVRCTDGKNTTVCNCRSGCSTR
jgi:hypothetical protein